MSSKERMNVTLRYQNEVKGAAADLANDILADPFRLDLDRHTHEFRCRVKSARERRDQRLAKLQAVKVELRHLIALKEWFVKAMRTVGPAKSDNEFGRYPVCFGGNSYCHPDAHLVNTPLCQACKAIAPLLLKDDC